MKYVRDLLSALEEYRPEFVSGDFGEEPFLTVSLMGGSVQYQDFTAYVGLTSQLAGLSPLVRDKLFLLVADSSNYEFPALRSNKTIVFPAGTDLNNLFAQASKFTSTEEALLKDSYILFDYFLNNGKLSDVVNFASQLVSNPLLVLDTSYKVLAYSTCYSFEDEQWEKNIHRGYCPYEYIAGFNKLEGVRNAPRSSKPFTVTCFTSPLNRCISKLYCQGKQKGFLLAIDAVSPFEKTNFELFEMVSRLIARIVDTNNQIARHSNSSFFDSIFIDALEDAFKTPAILRERLGQTGVNPGSTYRIIIVDISGYNNFDYNSEHLRNEIVNHFPSSFGVCYQNNMVALIDMGKMTESLDEAMGTMLDFLEVNEIRIAISDEFDDIALISQYYRQANSTLSLSARLGVPASVVYSNDFKYYELLQAAKADLDLSYYYSNEFKEIRRYDDENDTDYCETIAAYLACDKNAKKTGDRLHAHKNTVLYRLNKSRELFDFDCYNVDVCFTFLHSYRLEKMKKAGIIEG